MDLATFQAGTGGTNIWGNRPDAEAAVDAALTTYITSRTAANALLLRDALGVYAAATTNKARANFAGEVRFRVVVEHMVLTTIGDANHFLVDALIQQVGGINRAGELIQLARVLTQPYALQLPNLIGLAQNDLGELTSLVQHTTPANAYLLSNLIPLAGGALNLGILDDLVAAAGPAHVGLLPAMITDAGGAAAIPNLTAVITRNHQGAGNTAKDLTLVAAGNLPRFQQLAQMLPHFQGQGTPANNAAPAAVPALVEAERVNYSLTNAGVPGPTRPPYNLRIGQIEWAHFLERHTMHYFDFNNISPVNDQWPFTGAGPAAAGVANALVAAIAAIYGVGGNAWWLMPNAARVVNIPVFQATIGVKTGGPTLDVNTAMPGAGSPSAILGQFFPVPAGGGGVIPFDRAAAEAMQQLL